jgi:hypothetical protein
MYSWRGGMENGEGWTMNTSDHLALMKKLKESCASSEYKLLEVIIDKDREIAELRKQLDEIKRG